MARIGQLAGKDATAPPESWNLGPAPRCPGDQVFIDPHRLSLKLSSRRMRRGSLSFPI